MSNILSRDAILKASDIKTETVPVPEWGGDVLVRGMDGSERDQYEQSVMVQNSKNTRVNMKNARAKLVVLSVVDEAGKRLFSQADVDALSKKSAAALNRVFNVAARLSGITEGDLAEITEELAENPFGALPTD